jgi:hypothetical protein
LFASIKRNERKTGKKTMFYAKSSNGILRKKSKTRKHPLAPKKPRSAFILFSQHMHNEKDDNCKEMNQKVYNLHK